MDQVKIGKFIAECRRNKGLTQAALGEKLGVSNKTISRWENGNYMPDIEMLPLLAKEFEVSMEELLAGKRSAAENSTAVPKVSAFSLEERRAYFKRKWRKEHIALLVLLILLFAASVILPFALDKPYLLGLTPLLGAVEFGWQNNRMMIYVESNLYDGEKNS